MRSQFIPAVRASLPRRRLSRAAARAQPEAWRRWLWRALLRSRNVRRLLRHHGA